MYESVSVFVTDVINTYVLLVEYLVAVVVGYIKLVGISGQFRPVVLYFRLHIVASQSENRLFVERNIFGIVHCKRKAASVNHFLSLQRRIGFVANP